MKYFCLGYIKPGTFEGMTEDERHAVRDEWLRAQRRSARQGACRWRIISSASGDRVDPVREKRAKSQPLSAPMRNQGTARRHSHP